LNAATKEKNKNKFKNIKKREKEKKIENNQAKGASKWLTSRRLIDFDPLSLLLRVWFYTTVCKRESFLFQIIKEGKTGGGGGD
jgi:hypothetical protein